jgi:DNA-directed RNA polymerase specialized sigma24 family protein
MPATLPSAHRAEIRYNPGDTRPCHSGEREEGEQARAAEEHEYTEYVTARLPAPRRLAYQLVGDAHRADDVVQVAITRLYQHWGKARAATDLDAYVRKVVPLRFLSGSRGSKRTSIPDWGPVGDQSAL